MKRKVLLLAVLIPALSYAVDYDIRDYGAKEGTLNTEFIQKAVDACSADGGGRVIVPRGTWTSGTIDLKDGVILFLEKGSILKGSDRIEDYHPQHLVRAKKVSGAGIDGFGTIDGTGSAFWEINPNKYYVHKQQRSGVMVQYEDCMDMILRGVRLQNSESWAFHILACKGVKVSGLTIRNYLHGPTNDGIDIQASKDVIIRDCDIYTSDDAICIKNRDGRYYDRACANITVSDCILTTTCNCLKIGTETRGQIRNIAFSNCTLRQAQPGDPEAEIRLKSNRPTRPSSGISVESVDGSLVDGVTISNIAMEKVRCPIFIRLGARMAGMQKDPNPLPGSIRNVSITNVTCREAIQASIIDGIPGYMPENITISNYSARTSASSDDNLPEKTVEEKITEYPDAQRWGDMPASGFYIRHARNVSMSNVNCTLTAADMRPAFVLEDIDGISVSNLVTDPALCGNSAMRLTKVRHGHFSGIRIPGQTAFDWDLRGELNEDIHLSDANPAKVRSEKSCQVVQQTSFILK